MAQKYDAENLLETILGIMKTSGALNTKITAVEDEKIAQSKGLSPALKLVSDDSYFLQSWNEKILNKSPAIFYGIEDTTAQSAGSAVLKIYKIFVELVMVDNGMSNDGSKRIMRYARALEELFAENFSPAVAQGTVKVEAVRPVAFKLALDSDEEIKVGGVTLTIGIA